MKMLRELPHKSDDQMTGALPKTLGNLENLEILGVFDNKLSGTLPAELGGLSELKELVLANNQFYGQILKSLGQLLDLKVLQLQHNDFDSFQNLKHIESRGFLVFDYDREDANGNLKKMDFSRSRMAKTLFEDSEN